MAQYHFVDESGDPGLARSGTSSSHFILVIVQLSHGEPIPEIIAVRQQFHLKTNFEFHYYRVKPPIREAFFHSIRGLNFEIRAVVLNKASIPDSLISMSGSDLIIELLSKLALRIPKEKTKDAILILDSITPQLRQQLRMRLSKSYQVTQRKRLFKKLVSQTSESSDGLQFADMVAGAIRHHVTGRNSRYYFQIERKIADLWLL